MKLSQVKRLALFSLVLFFVIGWSSKASCTWTTEELIKAAQQGDAEAQYNLGAMYHIGEGALQDHKKALSWYKGEGVPQDYQKFFYWTKKAVQQGHAGAQFNLGLMYFQGKEVPQDYKKAVYWYEKSAEQGDTGAQHNLAHMYYTGEGVPQDYKRAFHWFKRAAEQGLARSQLKLGVMYYKGRGVPQNYVHSYAWFNLAAAQGDKTAISNRDIVSRAMPPYQIAQAQKLSAQLHYRINHPSDTLKPETVKRKESESSKTHHVDEPKQKHSKRKKPDSSKTRKPEIKGFGTGFIISEDGYVLTCYHVINKAGSIKVIVGDASYVAKLVRNDKINDLALLKISGKFSALAFSSKRTVKMGQEIFTIGYPNPVLQGVNAKLTKGTVNSVTGFMDDVRLYQISAPVQPGNSGGPLLDINGNVMGIVVAVLDTKTAFEVSGSLPQNVNYAVKSICALALLDTLPEVSEKLPAPSKSQPFDEIVSRVKKSVVMIVAYNLLGEKRTRKGRLYVDTEPSNARIRVLNIVPKFYQGMELDPGSYHIEVSSAVYKTKKMWVNLSSAEDKRLRITLEETPD